VREIPTCPLPYAVRETPHFVRGDINWFTSPRASAASVAVSRPHPAFFVIASRRQAAWQSPARKSQRQCGRPLTSFGVTLIGFRHRERAQRAWRSPARPLRRQCGRPLTSFGVTLIGLRHRERAQRAWRSPAQPLRRQGGGGADGGSVPCRCRRVLLKNANHPPIRGCPSIP
jgi:hypothetical protein